MKSDTLFNKVLITGSYGFTGKHIAQYLTSKGLIVFGLQSDLLDKVGLREEVQQIKPHFVVHLGAKSFVRESIADIYKVNVEGTTNLLDELKRIGTVNKVILASSATVYGNQALSVLSEDLVPKPVNHYGCSKLAMECMSQNYSNDFSIIITRPFNYTGVGQNEKFLVPKIVNAYKNKQTQLQLGNINVSREFNDIRDICHAYYELLKIKSEFHIVNLCSGRGIKLLDIITCMDRLSGTKMNVEVNPLFVRNNEIEFLVGDTNNLNELGISLNRFSIAETLLYMYKSH
jgi:nucleoside-diphosphate-sugar epimerase